MDAAAAIGRRAIRLANGTVNIFVLTVILLLLAFGCYSIWDSNQVNRAASAANYKKFKPTVEDEGLSFQELRDINPEVVGWLTVYGTNIDYPITQGENNMKYVNTNAMGKHSLAGAIFLDTSNSPDFTDFSSILYGHHMGKPVMFGEIGLYLGKDYFFARRYGKLYYDGKERGLDFFAFAHVDAYDNLVFFPKVAGRENQQAHLEMLLEKSTHIRTEVPVTVEDRIVLLATCSGTSTNGRDILIGKITDEIYDDTFKNEKMDTIHIPQISELPGLWAQAPHWARIILLALPFLLILLVVVLIHKKRGRIRKGRETILKGKGDMYS